MRVWTPARQPVWRPALRGRSCDFGRIFADWSFEAGRHWILRRFDLSACQRVDPVVRADAWLQLVSRSVESAVLVVFAG